MIPYKNTFARICHRYMCIKNSRQFSSVNLTQWKPTVGLEVHAQIATKSKLFSGASTNFNSPVNSCVSLFDCAVPGTMPVLNRKCVEVGVLTALALSCEVNATSMFERKHYFYFDLPAGFQITQQRKPLAVNGKITFNVFVEGNEPYLKSSKIKQIQLEQDSGRSMHNEDLRRSFIDLNRAGVPLMELVFEPDLTSGDEAAALARELCFTFELLETCSCKMEEGALRFDANVSINKPNEPLGTRTEIKNIGSIAALNNAITYEIERQISILESGGQIVNETRSWDPLKKKTILMREKEDRHDYRFMPEPNLLPLYLHVNENMENEHNLVDVPSIKQQLPELPEQIRKKLLDNGLTLHFLSAILSNIELYRLFYDILKGNEQRTPLMLAKIFISEVLPFLDDRELDLTFCVNNKEYIGELIDLLEANTINQYVVKQLLSELINEPNKTAKQIVDEKNWFVISDEKKLETVCLEVLEKNSKIVRQYKSGRKKVFKKFLHKAYEITEKRADMKKVSKIMTRLLS